MPSPFPCSPLIREWSCKKTQTEKKKSKKGLKNYFAKQFEMQILSSLQTLKRGSQIRRSLYIKVNKKKVSRSGN